MGGEKPNRIIWDNFKRGSPPHGRGKVIKNVLEKLDQRITPAWAGKRRYTAACIWSFWDHPRMGGEKSVSWATMHPGNGSPPHGRGKD